MRSRGSSPWRLQSTVNSLLSLLNALCENGQGLKCKIGTTNLGKLTDAQKAIATDKGWELV